MTRLRGFTASLRISDMMHQQVAGQGVGGAVRVSLDLYILYIYYNIYIIYINYNIR